MTLSTSTVVSLILAVAALKFDVLSRSLLSWISLGTKNRSMIENYL
jgi:hypothetical protein